MPSVQYLLLGILLLLSVGAVIAFSYFVIRPLRIYWAIIEGRKMVADREAGQSWRQLKDIREINKNWAE